MAQSPTHKFGQIIGDTLEQAVKPWLVKVAKKHKLYLDSKHPRNARGGKRKVSWTDNRGNIHDLDYVLEVGGSEDQIGRPKAFIEVAYRRYTKHSRNKAQEIQGAVRPLADTYSDDHPFLGAILAGVFTEGSLNQMRSLGFSVLYFDFDSVVAAFRTQGIDAYFDESTSDKAVQAKVRAYEALADRDKAAIAKALCDQNRAGLAEFIHDLEVSLSRQVALVYVLFLHGPSFEAHTVEEAIRLIDEYGEESTVQGFVRYEVIVRYTNGDEARGTFESKPDAIKFLKSVS